MAVCYEEYCSFVHEIDVFSHDRENQYHLVDLCVAVASDGDDLVSYPVKDLYYFFRLIIGRKIIPRAMVEQVPQKDQPVSFACLEFSDNALCPA